MEKKNPEEMSTRSLVHSLAKNRYNLWRMEYPSREKDIIISRYNEVFKELHKRGNCSILKDGPERLRSNIGYKIPLKEKTLETLLQKQKNVLTLCFGLKGTAYCECKICEMLNLTPYEVDRHLTNGIISLRKPSRESFNDNPPLLD